MTEAAIKTKWLKEWPENMAAFAKQRRRYNRKIKRHKDREAQEEYFEDHQYCEVCLAEGRGRRPADDVHEILYRSQGGECVPDNEISTCRSDHDRMHFKTEPYLRKEDLLRIKERENAGVVHVQV